MVSAQATLVGNQLDENHAPETNGRMAVCRKCGSLTDFKDGVHHVPAEQQLERSSEWLSAQSRNKLIDSARARRKS